MIQSLFTRQAFHLFKRLFYLYVGQLLLIYIFFAGTSVQQRPVVMCNGRRFTDERERQSHACWQTSVRTGEREGESGRGRGMGKQTDKQRERE